MKRLLREITLCCLFSVSTAISYAQDDASQQESASDEESETQVETTVIEEITVQGERTTFSLRMEIESAETEVYNLFNELNSNDDFDVTCKDIVYTGSHIPQRTCMSAFLREEQAFQTQSYLQGVPLGEGIGGPNSGALMDLSSASGEVREKAKAMEQEMIRLAVEVPEFAEALIKLSNLVSTLDERTGN